MRLLEVAVFFVFLISQDERQNGVVGDGALNVICIVAFLSTTVAFSLKYIQEMFFHHDTILSLMIQVRYENCFVKDFADPFANIIQCCLWIFSIVSVVLFLIFFLLSIINDVFVVPPSMMTTTIVFKPDALSTQPRPMSPWSIWSNLSKRLQAKFVAFIVFSWQNWRRLPFLGRSKSAFVSVPLCFWSDETQSLIFSQAELPKAKQYYGSSAFKDDEQMEDKERNVDNDDDDRLLSKRKTIINDI